MFKSMSLCWIQEFSFRTRTKKREDKIGAQTTLVSAKTQEPVRAHFSNTYYSHKGLAHGISTALQSWHKYARGWLSIKFDSTQLPH